MTYIPGNDPHHGPVPPNLQSPHHPGWPPAIPPKKKHTGLIVGLIVAAVVLILGATAAVLALTHRQARSDPTAGAVAACEDAVRGQLKAPATARFTIGRISEAGNGYFIIGTVDAENSFSALVRTGFSCSTGRTATGWTSSATLDQN